MNFLTVDATDVIIATPKRQLLAQKHVKQHTDH